MTLIERQNAMLQETVARLTETHEAELKKKDTEMRQLQEEVGAVLCYFINSISVRR